jgi:DNA-binding LacI/PurR family transcriptional regulator
VGADRPVTLRDVARHCGLSVFPVSLVLSGREGVAEATAARIRAAADQLGYLPEINQAARRLAARKSGGTPLNHVIGLLLPGHLGKVRFFYELFRGIAEEVSDRGFGLLMLPTYDPVAHRSLPVRLPPAMLRGEVDGLILHQGMTDEWIERLRRAPGSRSHPIVSLSNRIAGGGSVLRDERAGARLALEHLLALGHRRVLYLGRPEGGYPSDERLAGYREACAAAGLAADPCLLPVGITDDHLVLEPLREALRQHPEATALLTLNDPNALHACYALDRMGVRIPDDISVVGWDDTDPLPDAAGNNRLTSVAFDIADMGRTAARIVIEALAAPDRPLPNVTMPARLSVRNTTAPPPVRRVT